MSLYVKKVGQNLFNIMDSYDDLDINGNVVTLGRVIIANTNRPTLQGQKTPYREKLDEINMYIDLIAKFKEGGK